MDNKTEEIKSYIYRLKQAKISLDDLQLLNDTAGAMVVKHVIDLLNSDDVMLSDLETASKIINTLSQHIERSRKQNGINHDGLIQPKMLTMMDMYSDE